MKRFLPVFFFAALLATPACAIDLNQQLRQVNGKPFVDKDGKADPEATLGKLSIAALLQDKQGLSGAEKFARYKLATRIEKEPNAVLTAEETKLIKDIVGELYPPLVVGSVWTALDPGLSAGPNPPK